MAIQLLSNVKMITSGIAPTTDKLLPGQAAFGKITADGKYHLYGNIGEGGGAGKVVDIVADTLEALSEIPNLQTVLNTGNSSTLDILFKETEGGETLLTVGKGGVVAGTTKLTKDGFVDNGKVVLSANPNLVVSAEDAAQMRTFLSVYSKAEVDGMVAGAFHVKGCCDAKNLPTDAKVGDVWNITANTATPKVTDINGKVLVAGDNVVWVGADGAIHEAGWDALSGVVDLSSYYTKEEINGLLAVYAKSADVYTKTDIDGKIETINTAVAKAQSDATAAGTAAAAAQTQADKGVADAAAAKQAADNAQAAADAAKAAADAAQADATTANTEIGKTNARVTALEGAGYQTAADVTNILTTGHYVSDANYVHTDNNYTTPEMNKVAKLVIDGDGTKVLKNDGSYDTIELSVVSI